MIQVQSDFADVRSIVASTFVPPTDEHAGYETYEEIEDEGSLGYLLRHMESNKIALDTETYPDGSPFCLTFSIADGSAYFIDVERQDLLDILNAKVSDPDIITILHNSLFDLPVLSAMGVHPAVVRDTMVMAYLKQGEPQGLKPLAYRWCGMKMRSYKEVIGSATSDKAIRYLQQVVEYNWPDALPVTERPKGVVRVRQPQNIHKKAARIIKDTETKAADPYARWQKIEPAERRYVEQCFGPMVEASLADVDRDEAVAYACQDADATFRLAPALWAVMEERNMERTFNIDMGVIPMALDMMQTGIKVNVPYLRDLSVGFQKKLVETEMKIEALTGKGINPQAHDQVADLLFKTLGLKPIKKTKGGKNSTAEEVLARMDHPVVRLIQEHRSTAKLKGTYSDTIPEQAREGRVHGTIRLTRTATGRLSMANPNLQNQPVRTEEGRWIRKGFIASDGCSLVSSDYSQIELRMMAHMSQDPLMLKTFRKGDDIHAITASKMFGIPISRLDKMQHRYPAKRTNFGIAYDITAQGLYRDFQIAGAKGWTLDKCQELIDEWFKLYKGVYQWKQEVIREARLEGYVKDMFGRRRYVPAVRCADQYIHARALREAGNMPIQAGAQGVIKVAMGKLVPYIVSLRDAGHIINPLVQIHDDLLFEIETKILGWVIPMIQTIMESAVELSIPTPVDPEVGQNWAEMQKFKEAA
jgi:DNA polymerase I-like protein with 3'-5' exonuclease and polymerase domains